MNKNIIKNILIILLLPIMGLLLLILVHLLPTHTMLMNVYSCQDTLKAEFDDEVTIDGFKATLTGDFTDCIVLENAIYDYTEKHSVVDQVMNMYRPESYDVAEDPDGMQPGNSIIDYMNGVEQPRECSYGRYWHGYLLLIKPLLLFTSLNGIRLFNSIALLLVLVLCIVSLHEYFNDWKVSVGFALSIPFTYFSTTFQSLNLSICMYLMLAGVLVTLWLCKKQQKNAKFPWLFVSFFILLGALTSYFDFLTYPLVVLGYPLCIYLLANRISLVKQMQHMISLCLAYGFGYLYMWASKWILATFLTDSNIVADGLSTLTVRTGSANESGRLSGYKDVLSKNLEPFSNRAYLVLFLIILVFIALCIIKSHTYSFKSSVPFLLVAITPFIWWFIAANHSVQHWIYTCRIFSVFVLSIIFSVLSIVSIKKES